jgi:hypothetical protein
MVESMKGQTSHVQTVVFLLFALVFLIFMFGLYDTSLCNQQANMFNSTANYTSNEGITYFLTHAFTLQCSNVPPWVNILVYLPIIGGLIYSIIPFK